MDIRANGKNSILFAIAFIVGTGIKAQSSSSQRAEELQLNTITTAVPFLLITPDSRAGGMGDVGCASLNDVNAIHWNAAKLAFANKKMGFGVSYTPWLRALVPDINLAYIIFFLIGVKVAVRQIVGLLGQLEDGSIVAGRQVVSSQISGLR